MAASPKAYAPKKDTPSKLYDSDDSNPSLPNPALDSSDFDETDLEKGSTTAATPEAREKPSSRLCPPVSENIDWAYC